jgi:hypothetical protein
MAVMADLIRQGQQIAAIRPGDPDALAHLASVLTNEFASADVGLNATDFHALFDGALRVPGSSAGPAARI